MQFVPCVHDDFYKQYLDMILIQSHPHVSTGLPFLSLLVMERGVASYRVGHLKGYDYVFLCFINDLAFMVREGKLAKSDYLQLVWNVGFLQPRFHRMGG